MLTKREKQEQYEDLRERLSGVTTVFLMQNRGLSVNAVNELRSKIRQVDGVYKVYKNSVVSLAVDGTEMEGLKPHLSGPNALAYTSGDPVVLAKALREFIKTHPNLSFRKGYLEGHLLEGEEAQAIAELPSREELISRLLFLLQSPIRRLAVALNDPLQKLASALHQVAETKES